MVWNDQSVPRGDVRIATSGYEGNDLLLFDGVPNGTQWMPSHSYCSRRFRCATVQRIIESGARYVTASLRVALRSTQKRRHALMRHLSSAGFIVGGPDKIIENLFFPSFSEVFF